MSIYPNAPGDAGPSAPHNPNYNPVNWGTLVILLVVVIIAVVVGMVVINGSKNSPAPTLVPSGAAAPTAR